MHTDGDRDRPSYPHHTYNVIYRDTNGDGLIDNAFFTPGGWDGDFGLSDSNHDGRYDKATIYGYVVQQKTVDHPVYLDGDRKRLNKAHLSPRSTKMGG